MFFNMYYAFLTTGPLPHAFLTLSLSPLCIYLLAFLGLFVHQILVQILVILQFFNFFLF